MELSCCCALLLVDASMNNNLWQRMALWMDMFVIVFSALRPLYFFGGPFVSIYDVGSGILVAYLPRRKDGTRLEKKSRVILGGIQCSGRRKMLLSGMELSLTSSEFGRS